MSRSASCSHSPAEAWQVPIFVGLICFDCAASEERTPSVQRVRPCGKGTAPFTRPAAVAPFRQRFEGAAGLQKPHRMSPKATASGAVPALEPAGNSSFTRVRSARRPEGATPTRSSARASAPRRKIDLCLVPVPRDGNRGCSIPKGRVCISGKHNALFFLPIQYAQVSHIWPTRHKTAKVLRKCCSADVAA